MKKLLLSVAALFMGAVSFAQNKAPEGSITYTVEYQLPDNMKPYAAYFPKEATVYFRGDSTIMVQKATGRVTSVILNAKTDYMKLLLDLGAKKYVVNFTPADIEEIQLAKPEYTYTAAGDAAIGTYKGTKYTLKDKDGKTVEAVFTKDLQLPQNSMSSLFDASYGTPLSFTTVQGGMTMKATFKELKMEPVPAGTFAAPKDFEPITQAQLKAMQGGK